MQTISRRNFLKGSAAFAVSIPLASFLSACNGAAESDGAQTSQTQSDEPTQDTTSDQTNQAESNSAENATGQILVAYYSATGHTENVANLIAQATGADTFVITPAEPYTSDDLNYNDESSRVSTEHEDPDGRHVELEQITPDNFDSYNTVFVGYPIWWGGASWVLDDFAIGNDFTGKTVIPFCTSSSSGLGQSAANLAELAATGDWQEGMRFSARADEGDVQEWLDELGIN